MDLIIAGIIDIHTVLKTELRSGVTNPVHEYTEKFSGSALHIAVNASLLKAQVGIISPVGRDAVGLMDVLRRYQIDYSNIVLSSKKNANLIRVYTSNRHYSLYYLGAVEDLKPENIKKEYLKKAKAVHVCFPNEEVTEHLVKLAKKEKVLTSVDAAFSEADADIVFTEGKEQGKKEKNIVVIDFREGIFCNEKRIPVFRRNTSYKDGAKDAFIAAFLTRYMKSQHLEHSALYGSCAAYLCSQNERKILTCTKEELDALFDEKVRIL